MATDKQKELARRSALRQSAKALFDTWDHAAERQKRKAEQIKEKRRQAKEKDKKKKIFAMAKDKAKAIGENTDQGNGMLSKAELLEGLIGAGLFRKDDSHQAEIRRQNKVEITMRLMGAFQDDSSELVVDRRAFIDYVMLQEAQLLARADRPPPVEHRQKLDQEQKRRAKQAMAQDYEHWRESELHEHCKLRGIAPGTKDEIVRQLKLQDESSLSSDLGAVVGIDWNRNVFQLHFDQWWKTHADHPGYSEEGESREKEQGRLAIEKFIQFWVSDEMDFELPPNLREAQSLNSPKKGSEGVSEENKYQRNMVLRLSAISRVKWRQSEDACQQLWEQADSNNSGWATLAQVLSVISNKMVGLNCQQMGVLENAPHLKKPKLGSHALDHAKKELTSLHSEKCPNKTSAKSIHRSTFIDWWHQQPWTIKEYTMRRKALEDIWSTLGTSGPDTLLPWEAKALMAQVWDVKEETPAERLEFDERFSHWWGEIDTDFVGWLSIDDLSAWWVRQGDETARIAKTIDWDQAELHFDAAEILADVTRKRSEAADTDVDSATRDITKRYEQAVQKFDSETQQFFRDEDDIDKVVNVLRRPKKSTWMLKTDTTPFGVLKGAVRPPMIRTRLQNLVYVKDKMIIHELTHNEPLMYKLRHPLHARRRTAQVAAEVESERLQSRPGPKYSSEGEAAVSIGELLKDYKEKDRQCLMYHDVVNVLKKIRTSWRANVMNRSMLKVQRRFGHRIHQVLKQMQWMIWLNVHLAVIWFALVIVPRDYEHAAGGVSLYNSTVAVVRGIIGAQPGKSEVSSLYYDGYAKQPIYAFGFQLRMDLLYFVCIITNVLLSLHRITQGMSSAGSKSARILDSNQNKPGILGTYDFSVSNEKSQMSMRQEIRSYLDTWLQTHEEDVLNQEISASITARAGHQVHVWIGRVATIVLVVVDIYILTSLLKMGSFLSSVCISMLDAVMPTIIAKIVKSEKHIHHMAELSSMMVRLYAFKLIQFWVIVSSLRFSDAEDDTATTELDEIACPETDYGAKFLQLTLTAELVFIGQQYLLLHATVVGLPNPLLWYSVVSHFTKADPLGPSPSLLDRQRHAAKEKVRKKKLYLWCSNRRDSHGNRVGSKLQHRWIHPKPRTLRDYFHLAPKPKKQSTWWTLSRRLEDEDSAEDKDGNDMVKLATGEEMHHLTQISSRRLHVLAQLLVDAGYPTQQHLLDENSGAGLNPDEVADVIRKEIGHHSYTFTRSKHKNAHDKRSARQDSRAEQELTDFLDTVGNKPPSPNRHGDFVFVLGGAGAGKDELCKSLVQQFDQSHQELHGPDSAHLAYIAVDEIIRAELESPSFQKYTSEGKPVPTSAIVKIVRAEMEKYDKAKTFLLGGFPQDKEQAKEFMHTVGKPRFALFLSAGKKCAATRVIKKPSPTTSTTELADELEEFEARWQTYESESGPVIELMKSMNLLKTIDSGHSADKDDDSALVVAPRNKHHKHHRKKKNHHKHHSGSPESVRPALESEEPGSEVLAKIIPEAGSEATPEPEGEPDDSEPDATVTMATAGAESKQLDLAARERDTQKVEGDEPTALQDAHPKVEKRKIAEIDWDDRGRSIEDVYGDARVQFLSYGENFGEQLQAISTAKQELEDEAELVHENHEDMTQWRLHNPEFLQLERDLWKVKGQIALKACYNVEKNSRADWKQLSKALIRCEELLRSDETDHDMYKLVSKLGQRFNDCARKLKPETIENFATQIVNFEGEWTDVTESVHEQRVFKIPPMPLDPFRASVFMMNVLYKQTFIWVGSTWCPWLPFVAVVCQGMSFIALRHALLGGAYQGRGIWSADQIFRIFMTLAMATLLICALPILAWMNEETSCGPHSAQDYQTCARDDVPVESCEVGVIEVEGTHAKVYETLGVYLEWLENEVHSDESFIGEISSLASLLMNPPVLIITMLALIVRYRYQKSLTSALEQELADKSAHWDREKDYLETQLGQLISNQADGNSDAALKAQQQSKNANSMQTSNRRMDQIVKTMLGKDVVLPSGVNVISVSELQQMVEIMSSLEPSIGSAVPDKQSRVMFELLAKSTVLIEKIEVDYGVTSMEDFVTSTLQQNNASCMILACTVQVLDDEDDDDDERTGNSAFDEENVDAEEEEEEEWVPPLCYALVTFVQPASADATVLQYDADPNKPHHLGSTARDWNAITWEEAKHVRKNDGIFGIIGQLQATEAEADEAQETREIERQAVTEAPLTDDESAIVNEAWQKLNKLISTTN
eukprot:COSAG06_NODE_1392_length_9603_cov_310.303346_1_plen_2241_part_10